jgi:hypothetical protein
MDLDAIDTPEFRKWYLARQLERRALAAELREAAEHNRHYETLRALCFRASDMLAPDLIKSGDDNANRG